MKRTKGQGMVEFVLAVVVVSGLAVIIALAVGSAVQRNLHVVEKRGAQTVLDDVTAGITCPQPGQSVVELENFKLGQLMYCLLTTEGKMAFTVLTEKIDNLFGSREITSVPVEQVSKPANYLRSMLEVRGYVPARIWGELPEWARMIIGGQ